MASSFSNPRRLLVSNQASTSAKDHAEPGVEVLVDTLEPVSVMPQFNRAPVATHAAIPTSNADAYVSPATTCEVKPCSTGILTHRISGRPQLDTVPGSGIVLPGGANIYYLDLAPHSDSPMVRIKPLPEQPHIRRGKRNDSADEEMASHSIGRPRQTT